MLKMYLAGGKYDFISDANLILTLLGRIPFIKGKIGAESYQKNKKVLGLTGAIARLLFVFIKIYLLILFFMYLPMELFAHYMAVGRSGFKLVNSFAYFTLILVCICGSMMNSLIFNPGKKSYLMLHHMKITSKIYFRSGMLYKLVTQGLSFFICFMIFGIDIVKALYLVLLISMARFVGETLNILIFRTVGKPFGALKGANTILMLAGLFVAYFSTYLRGYVPNATNLVFHPGLMFVMLTVAAIFTYYVWNYHGYEKIVREIHTFDKVFSESELIEASHKRDLELENLTITEAEVMNDRFEKLEGFEYVNAIFFYRNRKLILRLMMSRIGFIGIGFGVTVVAYLLGASESIGRGISYSLPVLVLIMYLMSTGGRLCKMMFTQSDLKFLPYSYYRNPANLYKNFTVRLKYMTMIDLIPAGILVVAYVGVSLLIGKEASGLTTFWVSIGIILLSIFFSTYHLLLYYVLQPFDENSQVVKPLFTWINLGMYGACYVCLIIDTVVTYYTLGITLAVVALVAATFTLVHKVAPKTFHLR